MCTSSLQLSIPQTNKNATTDAAKNMHHGIYTCLRAYASGVLLTLSLDGLIIDSIVPELFLGPIRYCTYILMLASFSLVTSFVLPSKQFRPTPFQAIVETSAGLGWFVFGFLSANIFVLLLLGYELGRNEFLLLALYGLTVWCFRLTVWCFSRERVDDVEDADTAEDTKHLGVTRIV